MANLTIPFVQFWPALTSDSADLPNCPKGSVLHLCWSHSALSWRCMHITILNQSRSHADQYPTCSPWNDGSVLRSWPFLYEGVENNWSVTMWHLKILAPCLWGQQSYPGVTLASVAENYMEGRPCSFPHHDWNRIRVELIMSFGCHIIVYPLKILLVVTWYRFEHPDRHSRLISDHHHWPLMLKHRHKN